MENQLKNNNNEDWLFVTDRSNLITIFSSGVVQLASHEYQHRLDVRDEFYGRVTFFQSKVPVDVADCLKEEGSRTPVILRFQSELIEDLTAVYESKASQVVGTSDYPVSLRFLQSIEFVTAEDQKDSLERLKMLGSAGEKYGTGALFSAINPDVKIVDCIPKEKPADLSGQSYLDDAVGAIAAVLQVNAASESELQTIGGIARDLENIFHDRVPDSAWLPGDLESKDAALKSEFDRWLWPALVKKLLAVNSKDGFGNLTFLDEFINETTDLDDHLRPVAFKWRDFVKKILDNDIDVPKLDEKGWPVQRGALLFLLRRAPDRLLGEEDSGDIDSTVRAVAVAFSGCLAGLMGLDDSLRPEWPVCTSILNSLIDTKRGAQSENLIQFKLDIVKKSESMITLFIGSEPFKQFDAKHSNLNDYIYSVAELSGYELEIDCSRSTHKFTPASASSKKKGKLFYLTRVAQKESAYRPVRIESVCKDLTSKTALRSLTKGALVNLLKTGGATDGRCRYSISESRNAIIVIKDQLSESLDGDDFIEILGAIEVAVDGYSALSKKK